MCIQSFHWCLLGWILRHSRPRKTVPPTDRTRRQTAGPLAKRCLVRTLNELHRISSSPPGYLSYVRANRRLKTGEVQVSSLPGEPWSYTLPTPTSSALHHDDWLEYTLVLNAVLQHTFYLLSSFNQSFTVSRCLAVAGLTQKQHNHQHQSLLRHPKAQGGSKYVWLSDLSYHSKGSRCGIMGSWWFLFRFVTTVLTNLPIGFRGTLARVLSAGLAPWSPFLSSSCVRAGGISTNARHTSRKNSFAGTGDRWVIGLLGCLSSTESISYPWRSSS